MKIKRFDGINVVPFIDIMLVLLVIVLTTASFIAKGEIPLELPKSTSATPLKENRQIQIHITATNEIYLDNKITSIEQVRAILGRLDASSLVKINCDKEAKFDYFVAILDLFKANNFKNIAIVTQK